MKTKTRPFDLESFITRLRCIPDMIKDYRDKYSLPFIEEHEKFLEHEIHQLEESVTKIYNHPNGGNSFLNGIRNELDLTINLEKFEDVQIDASQIRRHDKMISVDDVRIAKSNAIYEYTKSFIVHLLVECALFLI